MTFSYKAVKIISGKKNVKDRYRKQELWYLDTHMILT